MRKLNIGLSDEQRAGVIELLNHDLSDAYLLLIKTKKYHWDVVGPAVSLAPPVVGRTLSGVNTKYRCYG